MFVALVPPEEAVAHLDDFLAPRRETSSDLRWVDPEQVHLTLAFLAAVEDRHLDDLVERLGRATARRTPFAVRIAGGGAFPHVARARVVWAGLAVDEMGGVELPRLATGARAAASRAGIAVDGQRFKPHVTLARRRTPAEVTRWVQLLDAYRGPEWAADRACLVQSHLGQGPRGRPRHDVVEEFFLGDGGRSPRVS